MRRFGTLLALALVVGVTLPAEAGQGSPGTGTSASGFLTSKKPQLVALAGGVEIIPIITASDVIGGSISGYQMSGIPDGIGAYRSSNSTVEVFVNHELGFGDDDPSQARVSHLTLDDDGNVLAATYAIDGHENFEQFCSSTLATLGGTPWYFTGEETSSSLRGGSSMAMNALSGRWVETPQFGHFLHENVVPLKGLSRASFFLSEDGQAGNSHLWMYTSTSFHRAIRGHGSLRVWVPTDATDRNPSADDIAKGESLDGHLVRIRGSLHMNHKELAAAANEAGAFDFVRIEDATADPSNPGRVYFSDTGAARKQVFKGRIYQLDVDPSDPTKATLSVLLDADAGDDMFNPDNLGISDSSLVIQEDRNYAHSGYNRVLVYSFGDESLTAVARTDPRPIAIHRAGGPGAWESSGVVDASTFYGAGWWLLDVQAGDVSVPVPGPSLQPNSAEGEGGQLLLMYVPGT